MQSKRTILGATAFSLALAGAGLTGALLGTPTSSSAQDNSTETTDTASSSPRFEHRGDGLAAAAGAIGISEDDLRTALADGQSIAQVAEANGVDVQTVVDALVAEATDRLETALAELPSRMTDLVNREGLPERGGPPRGGSHDGRPDRDRPGLDAAADAIGISVDDLRTAVLGGDTIAEVAAANNVDVQTVIDALVAEANARLEAAVADGGLSEAEAAERKTDIVEHITDMVNGELRASIHPHGRPSAA